MSNPDDVTHFKPVQTLAWWVVALFTLVTACEVVVTATDVAGTVMYPASWNDHAVEPTHGELQLAIVLVIGGVAMLGGFIAAIVVFCCWQYRVSANGRSLGARGMQFTPGWNVGWWFVPFANLVKPFQAMVENYKVSRPGADPDDWANHPTPAWISAWWAVWIVSNILSNIASRMSMRSDPSLVEIGVWIGAVSTLVSLVNLVLVVRLVRTITAWQTQRVCSEGIAVTVRDCPRCSTRVSIAAGATCPGCGLPMSS
jgi:hypothetical protein